MRGGAFLLGGEEMALSLKTTKIEGIPVLQVIGRLINVDSEKFQKKLDAYMKKCNNTAVIDITDVNFIDSFGLGTLVQHHSKMVKQGGSFILLNTDEEQDTYIKRLFLMTQLNKVFTIVESNEELVVLCKKRR